MAAGRGGAPVALPPSGRSNQRAFLLFVNRSGFPVDVGWVDYTGEVVRYMAGLPNGAGHKVNTYVTHPWAAWHVNTLEPAWFSGRELYLPKAWRGEIYRTVVFIDRPLPSLLNLTLQTVRNLVRVEDVEKLEIPRDLFRLLKQRRKLDIRDKTEGRSLIIM